MSKDFSEIRFYTQGFPKTVTRNALAAATPLLLREMILVPKDCVLSSNLYQNSHADMV